MKYSIVIPTYNHCDDLLKPCIDSIKKYTDLSNTEIIIVANGCTDNTKEYVNSLGTPFKLVWFDDAIGYTKATNEGIKIAQGKFIVLINNDIILLEQPKNTWLDLLRNPFDNNSKTGITGPVKFSWDCGGIIREAMAFWLVMIKKEMFDQLGLLDEIFSPGMGEDGDFSIKVVQHGYQLVSVPVDVTGEFNTGIKSFGFPIFHKGNGTFADNVNIKDDVIQRNNKILADRYGKKIEVSIIIPTVDHFEDALKPCLEAVLNYTDLTSKEIIVVCNGSGENTRQYLESLTGKVKYIWNQNRIGVIRAYNQGIELAQGKYIVLLDDDSILLPQSNNVWIDILKQPFLQDSKVGATGPFAHEYEDLGFVLHSGCAMYDAELLRNIGQFDEAYNPGYFSDPDVSMKIWNAGYKCLEVPEFNPKKEYSNSLFKIQFPIMHLGNVQTMNKNKDIEIVAKNRELLYSRYGKNKKMKKYSIVIPTYNHCNDLLKPCIESIFNYTDMSTTEIIVVANGCTDNTKEYIESLGDNVKLIWSDEALGYTKATNLGIKASTGQYVILLNNDTELLPQQFKNMWIDQLEFPFNDPTVGLTGPLQLHDNYSNHKVLIFFCVMIKRELFDKIGILDEIYTPGGGEDIDFTIRANQAGYKSIVLTDTVYDPVKCTNYGQFPIWHKDNKTFGEISEYTNWIVKRNGHINCKRYNKNIKLNIGAGGVDYSGYLSVDLHDPRAQIKMDITKLDFDDNSVTEILASHVFEHLNPYHVHDILVDWLRVLTPGGKIIMEMPNIEELCRRFVTASKQERYGILNAVYGSVNTTGIGGPDNITSPHLFGWWPEALYDHMMSAGFRDIVFMPEKIPHPESNFRVEAIKWWPDTHVFVDRNLLKTQEPASFIEIFEHNNYRIEPNDIQNKVIIDVGANLGMFSLRCAELNAKKIFAIEAQPTIYQLGLLPNVSKYNSIVPINLAMYDTDGQEILIRNSHVGSKVGTPDGDPVKTVTLAKFITDNQLENEDMVLKLDCEGSEFNILLPADVVTIRKFSVIYLEIHGNCNDNINYKECNIVREKLANSGFNQVSSLGQINWDDPSVSANIFVEKWVKI